MAKFAKKLGTIPQRFQFDLTIYNVFINVPYEVKVIALFKRGPKMLESKNKPTIDKGQPSAPLNETLSMLTTLYKDTKKYQFQERTAQVVIQLQKGEKNKSVGVVKLNLGEFTPGQVNEGIKQTKTLEKCPDKNASIEFEIKSKLIKEQLSSTDTLSQMSDAVSIDSGPESDYDFGELEENKESNKSEVSQFRRKIAQGSGKKPPNSLKTVVKSQNEKGKPPFIFKTQTKTGHDPDQIIKGIAQKRENSQLPQINEPIQEADEPQLRESSEYEVSNSIDEFPKQKKPVKTLNKEKIKFTNIQKKPYTNEVLHDNVDNEDQQPERQSQSSQSKVLPEALNFQTQQLQNKVISLEQEKQKLIDDYQKQLQQALKEKETQVSNYNKIENTLHKVESERDQLNLKVQQSESQLGKLRNCIQELEAEQKQLQNQICDKSARNQQQEEETMKKTMNQIKEQKKKAEQMEQELIDTKNRLKEKEKIVKQQDQEVESMNETIENLRQQLVETRQSTMDTQSQIEQNLKEKLNKLDQELSDTKKELRNKQNKIEEIQTQYEELEQSNNNLNFNYEKLEHEKQKLAEQVKQQQQQEKEMRKNFDVLQNQSKQQESQREKELEELRSQFEQVEVDKKSIEKRVKEKEKKIQSLESKQMDIEEEKLQQFNEYQEELESQKNRYDLQIVDLKKRIQELEEKCESMRSTQANSSKPLSPQPNESNQGLQKSVTLNDMMKRTSNERDVEEQQLLNELQKLRNENLEKDEQNYIIIQNLKEENSRLQKSLKQEKSGTKGSQSDRELAKLSVENEFLKKTIEELEQKLNGNNDISPSKNKVSVDSEYNNNGESEAELLKEKLKSLREENINIHGQLKQTQEEYNDIEQTLVDAKMQWASLDMENDQLAFKLKQKNEQLKLFSSKLTTLEIELVKTKDQLGEALNVINEYEIGDTEFNTDANMAFQDGESNDSSDVSIGGKSEQSGQKPKKPKAREKIKSFFNKIKK